MVALNRQNTTSQGFSKEALGAYYCWPAYMACYLTDRQGNVKSTATNPFKPPKGKPTSPYIMQVEYSDGIQDDHSEGKVLQVVTNTTAGSVVGYKYFDFGTVKRNDIEVILKIKPENKGYVEVLADDPNNGEDLGKVDIKLGGNGWGEFKAALKPISGTHSIYFIFHSEGKVLGDFSYFTFV